MSELAHDDYFPGEAFLADPEELDPLSSESYWKNHYALVRQLHAARIEALGSDRYLSSEEEQELAGLIRHGLQLSEYAKDFGQGYEGRYDADIEAGEHARRTLVVANLPYAAFFARASVGKVPKDTEDTSLPALPGDARSYVGTYSNVRNLANPRAEIDDRTQIAMEAMWDASGKFVAKRAKFSTFAAWYIQSKLQTAAESEYGGWELSYYTAQQYRDALDHQATYGVMPEIFHRSSSGNRRIGNHPDTVFEGRTSVPYDEAGHWFAPEECSGFVDEVTELSLADIVPDNDGSIYDIDREVARLVLRDVVEEMLWQIPNRERGVLSMRYGLDDGEEKILDEIGKSFHLTRERIRQMQSKALSRLRDPEIANKVRAFYAITEDYRIESVLIPMVDGVANVKTHRANVSKLEPEIDDETDMDSESLTETEQRQQWQAFPDDEWDDDIRPLSLQD